MKIINYNPKIHTAFLPDGKGRNPDFIGAPFDYSSVGVALESNGFMKIVTAIGENKVIGAKHYKLNVGDRITFFNRDNQEVVVEVVSQEFVDDVCVSTVNKKWLEENVDSAPLADYTNAAFKGKPTLTFGIHDASKTVIAGFTSVHAGQTKIAATSQRNGLSIDNGDSGAPNFVIDGGRLRLIGPHYSISPTYFYTSIAAKYANNISM